MMNGRGKSDSSKVPGKLPNKAEEPVAEAMEGRGLAKGNSPEGNVSRTQGRQDTLSALERVRQAARKDRKQQTKLVEFGRFAHRHASKRGRKRPQTICLLGFTLYCTRNQKGNFRIGMRTEKTRLRRARTRLQDQMRRMRHLSLQDQVNHLNQMLRGHYVYYGVAGNIQALLRVHRAVERYWRKMLSSRSWKATIRWEPFQRIKAQFPLLRPKLYLPYRELQAIAIL